MFEVQETENVRINKLVCRIVGHGTSEKDIYYKKTSLIPKNQIKVN